MLIWFADYAKWIQKRLARIYVNIYEYIYKKTITQIYIKKLISFIIEISEDDITKTILQKIK